VGSYYSLSISAATEKLSHKLEEGDIDEKKRERD
jgi:hypothetical protein